VDETTEAFEGLSEVDDDESVLPILEYFEDNFIGSQYRRAGRRRDPPYDAHKWNMQQWVEDNLPRSNNFAEGWHCRFQSNIAAYHPIFWKLIEILKCEPANELEIKQIIGGEAFVETR